MYISLTNYFNKGQFVSRAKVLVRRNLPYPRIHIPHPAVNILESNPKFRLTGGVENTPARLNPVLCDFTEHKLFQNILPCLDNWFTNGMEI
jgi:hypothetical protein